MTADLDYSQQLVPCFVCSSVSPAGSEFSCIVGIQDEESRYGRDIVLVVAIAAAHPAACLCNLILFIEFCSLSEQLNGNNPCCLKGAESDLNRN